MRKSITKTHIILLALLILILSCFGVVLNKTNSASVYFNGTTRKLPIYSVDRSDNKIAISFDCAYGAEYTDKLLEILKEYNVKCTFFVVKFWVDKYPDKVKKIIIVYHTETVFIMNIVIFAKELVKLHLKDHYIKINHHYIKIY